MTQGYADESFYASQYNIPGRKPVIPHGQFLFWAQRARTFVDQYTFNRIGERELDLFGRQIGMCICELAEHLYMNEGAENKQSESITGRSVTYIQGYEYRLCQRHLGMTGLMYRGSMYVPEGRVESDNNGI